jgi:hypothetical protein
MGLSEDQSRTELLPQPWRLSLLGPSAANSAEIDTSAKICCLNVNHLVSHPFQRGDILVAYEHLRKWACNHFAFLLETAIRGEIGTKVDQTLAMVCVGM